MPIEFIALGAPIAAKAVVPLVSYLGRSFQGDEEKLIRRSFVKAIREVREEKLQSQKKPRKGIVGKARGAVEGSYEKTTRLFKRSERSAEKDLASFLTQTWAKALADKASRSSQVNAEPEEAEERQENRGAPSSWFAALIDFLALTAHEGGKDVGPDDAERREAQEAWRHALVVAKAPNQAEAKDWAKQVGSHVVESWRRTRPLQPLIAQLNSDNQYGLMQAMVLSGQEIAESLRQIAKITVPTTLIGGGAVALLVLFVDKG